MGRKENVTYTYTDDLTGEEVEESDLETVEFSYGGKDYKIDLGPESHTALDEFLKKYVAKAERVKKDTTTSSGGSAPLILNGKTSADVREWWKENIKKFDGTRAAAWNENGRIFKIVYEAYNAAHPAK